MYEEWNGLVSLSKNGDLEAKEEVLNRLLPLIISSIKRYYNRREFYEELIQEGNLCILEAIESFDTEQNVYFLGYIKLQLRYLYLNKNRQKFHSSLNIMIGDESQEEIINTIPSDEISPDNSIVEQELVNKLNNSLEYLTNRQKQIIILFYVNRRSIAEIAESLNVSYRTVVNTKARALQILRKKLG